MTYFFLKVEAKELEACIGAETGETRNLAKKVKYYVTAREFIFPMAIMLFLSIVQGSCGVDTISYYSLTIFRLAKISVDEYLMAILLQVSLFSILESHHGFGIGVQIFKGCSAFEILFKIRFFAPGG